MAGGKKNDGIEENSRILELTTRILYIKILRRLENSPAVRCQVINKKENE